MSEQDDKPQDEPVVKHEPLPAELGFDRMLAAPRDEAIDAIMQHLTKGQVRAQFWWALDVMQALAEKGWKDGAADVFIREQLTRLQ